ncbi:MAG: TetR/AcrR family transcriptional regulator [Sphingobium sp.]
MPKRSPAYMAAQNRRILEAAIACIAEKGVERTSIDDIRKQAGLSGGTIYLHFANKEELILAAIREFSYVSPAPQQTLSEFRSFLETIPIKTALTPEQMVSASLRLSAEGFPPSPLNDELVTQLRKSLAMFTATFEALEKNGELALPFPPERMAKLVYAVEYGTGWLNLILGLPVERTMSEVYETLDFLLGARGAE